MLNAEAALSLRQYDIRRNVDQQHAPQFLLPRTHWQDETSQRKVVDNIVSAIDELLGLGGLNDMQQAAIKSSVQAPTQALRPICALRAYFIADFLQERQALCCDIENIYSTYYGFHQKREHAWHAEISHEAELVRAIVNCLPGDWYQHFVTLVHEKNALLMDIERGTVAMPERMDGANMHVSSMPPRASCGDSSGSDSEDSSSGSNGRYDIFDIIGDHHSSSRSSGSIMRRCPSPTSSNASSAGSESEFGSSSDSDESDSRSGRRSPVSSSSSRSPRGSGNSSPSSAGSRSPVLPPLHMLPDPVPAVSVLPVCSAIPIVPKGYVPSAAVYAQLVADGM